MNWISCTSSWSLSLPDALPISDMCTSIIEIARAEGMAKRGDEWFPLSHAVVAYDHAREREPFVSAFCHARSEEHTSELQSPDHLVCRLLLEKKKQAIRSSKSEQ